MVEHQLPKLRVAGSNPVSRSIKSTTYGVRVDLVPRVAQVVPRSLIEDETAALDLGIDCFDILNDFAVGVVN